MRIASIGWSHPTLHEYLHEQRLASMAADTLHSLCLVVLHCGNGGGDRVGDEGVGDGDEGAGGLAVRSAAHSAACASYSESISATRSPLWRKRPPLPQHHGDVAA